MSTDLKIIFAGTPAFAAATLQALIASVHQVVAVYTQPDRPAGRGKKVRFGAVKEVAMQANIPVLQPLSFNHDECLRVERMQADMLLVSAYGILLPAPVLQIPGLMCINIHTSLLPRWRGAAPIQRAILAGDTQTGITIMQIAEALDAGPILHQLVCAIEAEDSGASLRHRLTQMAAQNIVGILERVKNNEFTAQPQAHAQASYAHKITKQEAIIDWRQSAQEIARKIRAFYAWPVAYTYLHDQRIRIWQAEPGESSLREKPGYILGAHKDGLEVATGEGILSVKSLQLPGKKVISARDFVNAHNVLPQCFSDAQAPVAACTQA